MPNPAPNAWLLLSVGAERQHGGNDGYLDEPSSYYQWDSTVPNHGEVRPGDLVVLWDKRSSLGASVVERITSGTATKKIHRCPHCGTGNIKARKTLKPLYRCFQCSGEFDDPVTRTTQVATYRADYSAGWTDLTGLAPNELRALCVSPKSQHSMRPMDRDRLTFALGAHPVRMGNLKAASGMLASGFTLATVRVRRGQPAFRQILLEKFGSCCAFTGPAPEDALEAAHLYSFAAHGRHDSDGGLLLRRDLHRLFDTGSIAVTAGGTLDVSAELTAYDLYAGLHGRSLTISPTARHRRWLAAHWEQHRDGRQQSLGTGP